jgi:hypothetical protein
MADERFTSDDAAPETQRAPTRNDFAGAVSFRLMVVDGPSGNRI